jgi:hypothetical protein
VIERRGYCVFSNVVDGESRKKDWSEEFLAGKEGRAPSEL